MDRDPIPSEKDISGGRPGFLGNKLPKVMVTQIPWLYCWTVTGVIFLSTLLADWGVEIPVWLPDEGLHDPRRLTSPPSKR